MICFVDNLCQTLHEFCCVLTHYETYELRLLFDRLCQNIRIPIFFENISKPYDFRWFLTDYGKPNEVRWFFCHVMSRPAPPLPGPLIARAAAGEPNGCVTCFRQGADLAVRENHLFTMVLNKKRHVTHCVFQTIVKRCGFLQEPTDAHDLLKAI